MNNNDDSSAAPFDDPDWIDPEDRKAWALHESNERFPTCEAVGHCPRPTHMSAPFHHFYWDADRDTERLNYIHEHGAGHNDPMSEYGTVICKTCSRRALVIHDAEDFPEI
jgi:hypothetical protein